WILDANTLRRREGDRIVTILDRVSKGTDAPLGPASPLTWSRASSVAPASDGRVLVACPGDRRVVRVDRLGRVATVLEAEAPWAPASALETGEGAVLVLEHAWTPESGQGPTRVRRLDDGGITVLVRTP
ncbi:MAG: hypothetical protein KDA28_02170, partial [Phycisphaerales bacterium]|nr:hypothetical protein [Phycisphaerales bacterium]